MQSQLKNLEEYFVGSIIYENPFQDISLDLLKQDCDNWQRCMIFFNGYSQTPEVNKPNLLVVLKPGSVTSLINYTKFADMPHVIGVSMPIVECSDYLKSKNVWLTFSFGGACSEEDYNNFFNSNITNEGNIELLYCKK